MQFKKEKKVMLNDQLYDPNGSWHEKSFVVVVQEYH